MAWNSPELNASPARSESGNAASGDGINGILGPLGRAGGRFEFIQCIHEEVAAFSACAHAKYTDEVGICLATSGPGAIHLLNGLYDAKADHQPVVAIVGQQSTKALGGHYQQEVDLILTALNTDLCEPSCAGRWT